MVKRIVVFFLLFGASELVSVAQGYQKLTHFSGSKVVNGTTVKITCKGATDSVYFCKPEIGPYTVGRSSEDNTSGNGRITFTFSKPVSDIIFDHHGLSNSGNDREEVILFVNGLHYIVTQAGNETGCDGELSIITKKGNIGAKRNCPTSGWKGVKINGPIYSLIIVDTVISGGPNGTLFTINIGEIYQESSLTVSNTLNSYTCKKVQNSAGYELVIESTQLENVEIHLKDTLGNNVSLHYLITEPSKVVLDISDLPKGEYILELNQDNSIETQKILIE